MTEAEALCHFRKLQGLLKGIGKSGVEAGKEAMDHENTRLTDCALSYLGVCGRMETCSLAKYV